MARSALSWSIITAVSVGRISMTVSIERRMRNSKIKVGFGAFTLIALFTCSFSARAEIGSGWYEDVAIAVHSPSKIITGYYESESGDQIFPSASCTFYFVGKVEDQSAKIRFYVPFDGVVESEVAGELRLLADRESITIRSQAGVSGCFRYEDFYVENPASKSKTRSEDWIAIGLVVSAKAFIYREVGLTEKAVVSIENGDVVFIRELGGDEYKVTYIDPEGKKFDGWMSTADFLPLSLGK